MPLTHPLDLRIPPPLVATLMAVAMWGISSITGRVDISMLARVTAASIMALVGIAIAIAGVVAFRRVQTTVSPFKPQATSRLVTSGIYRFTRNPMYLGLCMVLVAWAVLLSSAWALLGPLAFIVYITRFQIKPEERALAGLFGTAFADYRARVRRWV